MKKAKKYDKVQAILPGLEKPGTPTLLTRQIVLYEKIGLYENAEEICKYLLLNGRKDFHSLLLADNFLHRARKDTKLTAEQVNQYKKLAYKYFLYAAKDNLRRYFDRNNPMSPSGFWITRQYIHQNFRRLSNLAKTPQISEQIRLIEEYIGKK